MKLEIEKFDTDGNGRLSKAESDKATEPVSWKASSYEKRLIKLCEKMNGGFKAGRPLFPPHSI